MKLFGKFIIVVVFLLACVFPIFASDIEGTLTYRDYIFVLVHGINADGGIFEGKHPYGNLKKYLEDDLGLKGRVFAYTFKDPNGSNYDAARELGDMNYHNPKPEMNGERWLDKAKEEFMSSLSNPPGTPVPTRFILITHSMGNLAARSYIYSEKIFGQGKGFYRDDVAKVVFVAPPLLGSDNVPAMIGFWLRAGKMSGEEILRLIEAQKKMTVTNPETDGQFKINEFQYELDWKGAWQELSNLDGGKIWQKVQDILMNPPGDNPFAAYYAAVIIAGIDIFGPQIYSNGFGYASLKPWWLGMIDLMPADVPSVDMLGMKYANLAAKLKDVKFDDPVREPAYSIVYGRGIPVADWKMTLAMMGIKSYDQYFKQNSFIPSLNYGVLSLPFLGQFPTNQGEMLSVTSAMMLDSGFMTNDGDGLVPTYSARGDDVAHLKNAQRREHVFKTDHFEKYLSEQFVAEIAVTEAAIATAATFSSGFSPPWSPLWIAAWKGYWWMRIPAAISLVDKVHYNVNGLRSDIEAHGRILEQYDLIEKAVLDTPAIFTINDLQTTAEAKGSPEAGAMAFSVSSPEAGYRSIAVRGLSENRAYSGLTNMAVPMTLKTTGEGERRYAKSMTVTEPPTRVAGKLNYLIPSKMKQFEYSFNFSAWQPITNINPESGEFFLDNLPFAEGMNIMATRAINAADVPSHQIIRISLNSTPQFVTAPYPEPFTSTNNVLQPVGVTATKAVLSSDPSEKILLPEFLVDGIDRRSEVDFVSTLGTYTAEATLKWIPKEPLPEGEHTVLVKFQSNVGVTQAIWSYYVDTTAPVITVATLEPYSPRGPAAKLLDVKYSTSDNRSQFLKKISARVYKGTVPDEDTNFVTEITTIATQAAGEQYVNWDGKDNDGNFVSDGIYTIRIKGYDEANNWSAGTGQVKVDSTPPEIIEAHVSPSPMTKASNEFGFAGKISEKSAVILKLTNLSENQTSSYLTQGQVGGDGGPAIASYAWRFDDPFIPNLKDGLYRIEVTARDEAGNESSPRTLEAVRIDRTPPAISDQYTDPFVLSNIGANPYKTTLRYRVSESNDAADNKQPTADNLNVKVKLYNENTGENLWAQNSSGSLTDENTFPWIADSSFGKGAYKFQIVATDRFGNYSTAYASCVKDGVAPVISSPSGGDVSGTVTIRGTAMDPDWTNDKPFKDYQVYYKKTDEDWKSDFIEVPPVNRDPKDPKNISIRPLQNNATLAYLYTNSLENGEYTIKVVVDEEGHDSIYIPHREAR